jgi:peptidoglycan/LPS O-acetylase OafA/YrhL
MAIQTRMPERRIASLDGLRGIAILLVVTSHFGLGASGGMVGVTLFFVLSGFLITSLLLEERERHGSIDLRAFYGRRALRLLPALAFYLFGMALLVAALRLAMPIWDITWPPALYVANYSQILGMDLAAHRHTWSLAVEEHFYLVWPVLFGLGVTKRIRWLTAGVLALAIWRVSVGLWDPEWAYMGTDTNAYALGLGCLLAAANQRGLALRLPRWTAGTGVVVLIGLGLAPFTDLEALYRLGVWLPIVAAAVSALVILAALRHSPGFLSGRLLMWFGGVSYALYLWHAPLLLFPIFEGPVGNLIALMVSVLMATISWKLIEGPVSRSRLRQRLSHRSSAPPVSAGVTS